MEFPGIRDRSNQIHFPVSRTLHETGELSKRVFRLKELQSPCQLCPRECFASREDGDLGICQAPVNLKISSAFPHFGEERELVGRNGSGTIFFSHCNLRCVFCQNYEISHYHEGHAVSVSELAETMLGLQHMGCHNINLVTPSHYVPQIVEALEIALQKGLNVPIVYNCSGYEKDDVLELLNGVIDIYMPDIKFATCASGERYANAPDYFMVAQKALKEMNRQVGVLQTDSSGIAFRGVLIRHLVLPGRVNESKKILQFIADELGTNSYVNIMDQYYPSYQASKFPELRRRITFEEMQEIKDYAHHLGLYRGF